MDWDPIGTERRLQDLMDAVRSRVPSDFVNEDGDVADGVMRPLLDMYLLARIDGATHSRALEFTVTGLDARLPEMRAFVVEQKRDELQRLRDSVEELRKPAASSSIERSIRARCDEQIRKIEAELPGLEREIADLCDRWGIE